MTSDEFETLEEKAQSEAKTEPTPPGNTTCPEHFPDEHRVTWLPYFDANQTLPCMYAGLLPANQDQDAPDFLFYWMYPAADFENAPLAIWLNGGPGASS